MQAMMRRWRDRALYLRLRNLRERDWRRRHRRVMAEHPEYATPCALEIEREHQALWAPLAPRVDPATLRICSNLSGVADPRYIPEAIFATDIEPLLGQRQWCHFLQHKSLYQALFPSGGFPTVYLHGILGSLYSADLDLISPAAGRQIVDALAYPVLLKPNTDSMGGAGVVFCDSPDRLWEQVQNCPNFVVQPVEQQDAYFQRFNPAGLNTCRVDLYRSVVTDEVHVLNVALRMGCHGSLDNETAGGIVCCIQPSGEPNAFAVDKYGGKFFAHPDSGVIFSEAGPLPNYQALLGTARHIAQRVPGTRLVALDMFYDTRGRWRCLEVNLVGLTIRFAQYAGRPYFGDFTREVIDFASAHERRRLATWRVA